MGYPMDWYRVLIRNKLEGDYDEAARNIPAPVDPRPLIRGDLRRLETDQRDARHLAVYASRAGVTPAQVKQILDDFFGEDVTFKPGARVAEVTDAELAARWNAAGGAIYADHIEPMHVSYFFEFLRKLRSEP